MTGGWYVCIIDMGRDVRDSDRDSDRKRCCVVGEGESLDDWPRDWAETLLRAEVSTAGFLGK